MQQIVKRFKKKKRKEKNPILFEQGAWKSTEDFPALEGLKSKNKTHCFIPWR